MLIFAKNNHGQNSNTASFFMKYEMFYRFVTGSWKINQMIWALKKKRVNSANSSVNSQHKSATRQMVLRYHVCHFDKGFSSSSPQFFGTRWVPENTQEEVALSLFPFITGKTPLDLLLLCLVGNWDSLDCSF